MSLTSEDESLFSNSNFDLNELDEEEENLLAIKKQLMITQQFRIDQERKNAVISTLRKRIEVLEDQKSMAYSENEQLRQQLHEKDGIEKLLNSMSEELETLNDKNALLQLDIGNGQEELKSQVSKNHLLKNTIENAKQKISERDIQITSLEQCIVEEKNRQRALERKHKGYTTELFSEIQHAKKEYTDTYEKFKLLHEELSTSVSLLRNSEKEKEQLERALKHAESTRATMLRENKELMADNEMLSGNNAQLQEVLAAVKAQMHSASQTHREKEEDLKAEMEDLSKECTKHKHEALKLRLILVNIGSAVENHVEGRTGSTPNISNHQSLYGDTPEDRCGSPSSHSRHYSLYSELQTPIYHNSSGRHSCPTGKDSDDQAIAAMVCKLLAENVRITQDNQELVAKHNTVAVDLNSLKSSNREAERRIHEYQCWLGEVDEQIELLEERLAEEPRGSRITEQLERDCDQADPKVAQSDPPATRSPAPERKSTPRSAAATISSSMKSCRSPSPSSVPLPELKRSPIGKSVKGKNASSMPHLQSHDLRHARLARVTDGLQAQKKREQALLSKNAELQEVISNLELQAVRSTKDAERIEREHECSLKDARLQHERQLREAMNKYYAEVHELRRISQEAEAAVDAVTKESELEIALLSARSKGQQHEEQELLQRDYSRRMQQIDDRFFIQSEQSFSVLLYLLHHYLRLKERYAEVVTQKKIITTLYCRQEAAVKDGLAALARRHDERVSEMAEVARLMKEQLNSCRGDDKGKSRQENPSPRIKFGGGPLDEPDHDSEISLSPSSKVPVPVPSNPKRRMTLRIVGLVIVTVCHMRKLLQVSRTKYCTVTAKNKGETDDFLDDLLRATGCDEAVHDLVGVGAKKASGELSGLFLSSTALARRSAMLLHAPVVLALAFLNREAEHHQKITEFKNEIINKFNNAIPINAVPVTSSSYFTAQTESLLKSIKYSYRMGAHQHYTQPLCMPLAITDEKAADDLVTEIKRLAASWAQMYSKLGEASNSQETLLREARASLDKQRRAVAALRQQKRGEEQEILSVLGKLNVVHAESPFHRKSPKGHSASLDPGAMRSTESEADISGDIRRNDYMQTDADVNVSSPLQNESIIRRKLEGMIPSRSVSPRVTAVNASRSMYSALYVSPNSRHTAATFSSNQKSDNRK